MKRFMLVVIMILATSWSASASQQDAATVAKNFLAFRHSLKTVEKMIPLIMKTGDQVYGYQATLSGGGYLLLTATKQVLPVKAFSLQNSFEDLPEPYRNYLMAEMQASFSAAQGSRLPQTSSEASTAWDFLLQLPRVPQTYAPDTFLLTTTWDQGYPYNKFLPEVGGQHVLVGCVNVAMGQLMNYHQWPPSGRGVVYHDWSGQELRSVLYHPLEYARMPDSLTASGASQVGIDEVAHLLTDLGVANNTAFSVDKSGTNFNPQVLIDNFGYAPDIKEMATTDSSFFITLGNEIDNGRPVLISIPGHMAVVDGYASDPTGTRMHLNLGWGGTADDFYYLDQDIIAGNIIFSSQFPFIMYYNILPCKTVDCDIILEAGDSVNGNSIAGVFDKEDDIDWFPVYLSGDVTLSGTSGYSDQAFFISLYDNDGRYLAGSGDALPLTGLAAGRYYLRSSLKNEHGGFYTYNTNFVNYTITITGHQLSAAEQQALNLDHPPEFATSLPELLVLGVNSPSLYNVLIDVRDPDDDAIAFSLTNSNPQAISASLNGRVLYVTPLVAGGASKITVTAKANGVTISDSTAILVTASDVGVGPVFTVGGTFSGQAHG